MVAGVSNGKHHAPNTLYCNALSVLVAFVLGFHISGYEVTGRDLRLCEWWERANAITEAFFWVRRSSYLAICLCLRVSTQAYAVLRPKGTGLRGVIFTHTPNEQVHRKQLVRGC